MPQAAPHDSAAALLARAKGGAYGTLRQDAAVIAIHESALTQILDYSEEDVRRERGGFLLGQVLDLDGLFVEIRHFLPALDTRSKAGSLTFTHDTWSALHREVQRQFPEERIVGWHHTHPGFGVFLSAQDRFLHRNFFSEPWQVALVVDPRRQELGFYEWQGRDVIDCGFLCIEG